MDAKWPEAEARAMRDNESWYMGSAVCRRGHVETVASQENNRRHHDAPSQPVQEESQWMPPDRSLTTVLAYTGAEP
jgi:hypothetical protein